MHPTIVLRPLRTLPRVILPRASVALPRAVRPLSVSAPLLKKNRLPAHPAKTSHPPSADKPTPNDGLDLKGQLESFGKQLKDIKTNLQAALRKLQSHARNEPAVLESLMVDLGKGDKVRLGDLAHVIGGVTVSAGKGGQRGIGIVVYDSANVKRIMSALSAPPNSFSPQINSQDPLKIEVPLPPPTKEDRLKTAELVGKEGDKAYTAIKDLRHEVRKKIKSSGGRPDDVIKAEKKLEQVVKEGNDEVKKVIEQTKKAVVEG